MRPGFNPSRRNRNIGTEKQGHGQNNQFADRGPAGGNWVVLVAARELHSGSQGMRRWQDCVHGRTVADTVRVLNLIPSQDYARLAAMIPRQAKTEEILLPLWGRMGYWAGGGVGSGAARGNATPLETAESCRCR